MKRFLIAAAVLSLLSTPAVAQERQVYASPYPRPNFTAEDDIRQSQQAATAQNDSVGAYRVYPGRENYGQKFGRLPRHPGDYRDAVDRGQWSSSGGGEPPFYK